MSPKQASSREREEKPATAAGEAEDVAPPAKKTRGPRARGSLLPPAAAGPSSTKKKAPPTRAQKGKAKAVAPPPKAKAPAKKREATAKGKATAKKATATAKGKAKGKAEPKKPKEESTKLPPPLGTVKKEKKAKGGPTIPGWHSEGLLLWKSYGDLSRMPKTDSVVAVSLNDGPIQVGDPWRRKQGWFAKDEEEWIWWSSACVPALRAIANGSAGAAAFSPEGGEGLARSLPKEPVNLVAKSHGSADAAVDAAEAAAEAALSKVPPAPPRPLFLLRSDGTIKGAVNGKAAQKLERIFDAAAAQVLDVHEGEEEGSTPPPFVACIFRSKNKEGMLEEIAEHVAPKLGLPAPDPEQSTFVAGAVGKSWFGGGGGGGGGGRGRGGGSSAAAAPPSDADAQFALNSGFRTVLEMPDAFGPSELKHSVKGRHGFLEGAWEHVSAAEEAATAAAEGAAAAGAAAAGGPSSAAAGATAPPPSSAPPTDGRALIDACDRVLQREAPGIKNNRRLVAMFQALRYYWKEVAGEAQKARAFEKVAASLASKDEELGVLDTPEKFEPLCVSGKGRRKLAGFAEGTLARVKEWMETGLPSDLEDYEG